VVASGTPIRSAVAELGFGAEIAFDIRFGETPMLLTKVRRIVFTSPNPQELAIRCSG
jgi:hypothetical protein